MENWGVPNTPGLYAELHMIMPTPEFWEVYLQILTAWLQFFLRSFNIYLKL